MPDYEKTLTDGLTSFISDKNTLQWLFDGAVGVISGIFQSTVGKLYNSIGRFISNLRGIKRNFTSCLVDKDINLDELLKNRVHGILDYEITKVTTCVSENIIINNHFFGKEFIIDVFGKFSCKLRIFQNNEGEIIYL